MSTILSRVYRNGILESTHRGSIVIVDGKQQTIASTGDIEQLTFWRSAAKIFQAIPFVTSGAADRFGFSEKELALACASHSGEAVHIELALGMLEKGGFKESDLGCGPHEPFDVESNYDLVRNSEKPGRRHNNCSGKHAAMLAFASHIGVDPSEYLNPESEVQKQILRTISDFTDVPIEEIGLGTDGCSAPNFAVPLSAMARAFSKLIRVSEEMDEDVANAVNRLIEAKLSFPEMVGGRSRLDTILMKNMDRKLICKVGAEGVWCAAIFPNERWRDGLAIALKIEDGNDFRARPAVVVELLRRLDIITPNAEAALGDFSPQILKNANGLEVGKVTAEFEMEFYESDITN